LWRKRENDRPADSVDSSIGFVAVLGMPVRKMLLL
jgi:hypothetical protein